LENGANHTDQSSDAKRILSSEFVTECCCKAASHQIAELLSVSRTHLLPQKGLTHGENADEDAFNYGLVDEGERLKEVF
jgi:hypothetical protein